MFMKKVAIWFISVDLKLFIFHNIFYSANQVLGQLFLTNVVPEDLFDSQNIKLSFIYYVHKYEKPTKLDSQYFIATLSKLNLLIVNI